MGQSHIGSFLGRITGIAGRFGSSAQSDETRSEIASEQPEPPYLDEVDLDIHADEFGDLYDGVQPIQPGAPEEIFAQDTYADFDESDEDDSVVSDQWDEAVDLRDQGLISRLTADEVTDFDLERFEDDGGPHDVIEASAIATLEDADIEEPTVAMEMASSPEELIDSEPSVHSEAVENDAADEELIPEIDPIALDDIDHDIQRITGFEPERDIIGVQRLDCVDADPRYASTSKLEVAKVKGSSSQVIILDDIPIAHVESESRLRHKDVAILDDPLTTDR